YLSGRRSVDDANALPLAQEAEQLATGTLRLEREGLHHVQDLSVELPVGQPVRVTELRSSAQSTPVTQLPSPALQRTSVIPVESPGQWRSLPGHEHLLGVTLVDQSPIGRTTRSNPASFVGAFDPTRNLFAKLPEAKGRGYTPGTFS